MARVTVFHTSDMHNKLTPELAERLRDLVGSHSNSLMLDSGDAIWSGNIYWRPGGEPILDLMNSVPYDAMCMGNREFHFMQRGIKAKMGRAKFPVVSSNLMASDPDGENSLAAAAETDVVGFVRFHFGPLVVAVFGLCVPCITKRMLAARMSKFYFADPGEAAADVVPGLRECDLVVALTHIGIQRDRELAETVPGIDVILGGHTHTVAEERVGDTTILHSGMYAHYVRKVEIELKAGKIGVKSELIPLGKA
jgi:2',3'-cyclic-nucleotide 2'-phosphodiesterase (5'-nucleotidase family)